MLSMHLERPRRQWMRSVPELALNKRVYVGSELQEESEKEWHWYFGFETTTLINLLSVYNWNIVLIVCIRIVSHKLRSKVRLVRAFDSTACSAMLPLLNSNINLHVFESRALHRSDSLSHEHYIAMMQKTIQIQFDAARRPLRETNKVGFIDR